MEIITEKGEHLDIAAGYSFDFEFTNPMLSESVRKRPPGRSPTPRATCARWSSPIASIIFADRASRET